jgi:hypothetical protein
VVTIADSIDVNSGTHAGNPQVDQSSTLGQNSHLSTAAAAPKADDAGNAFLLGWSVAELIGRVQVPATTTAKPADARDPAATFFPFISEASDVYWMVSMWRVNFERVSQLTNLLFPKSSTLNTRWDPGDKQPPYLYPPKPQDDPEFVDYADIGSVQDPDGEPILPEFRLHEATRRALNSLSLLSLTADASLLPDVLTEQQQELVQAVLGVQPATDASGDPVPPSADSLAGAAHNITAKLLLFLHAWEGYLRESVYAAGADARSETVLMAFEAGRSMSALSWSITIDMLAGKNSAEVWRKAFTDTNISRLQHQIAVMKQAAGSDPETPSADGSDSSATESATDENVPGADALDVVMRSLDYWQRATQWMIDHHATDDQWKSMRIALIEQTGIWQSLCLGEVSVASYTSPGTLQRILQDVVESFETLAAERGIIGASQEVANEALTLAKQAAAEAEQLAAATANILSEARRQIWTVVFSIWPILVLGVVAIVALGAGLILFSQTGSSAGGAGSLAATLLAVVGGLGLWGTHSQTQRLIGSLNTAPTNSPAPTPAAAGAAGAAAPSAATQSASLADRLGAFFGRAADTVLDDFEKGFKQIQRDLRYLSRTVAVSYPLIEYFVLDGAIVNVRDPFQFIEQIVWNQDEQKQEVMRVAYAAFGAIGSFAMAAAFNSDRAPKIGEAASNSAPPPTGGGDHAVVVTPAGAAPGDT